MPAEPIVFYSWQSDRPAGVTRAFIRDALDAAAAQLAASVSDAVRIDSDTKGIPGTPAIGETIFRKIDSAAVFVADVTFIGSAATNGEIDGAPKLLPNPSVLVETGYAGARLGWERVILVSNSHYGDVAQLPFDLRFRRFPITYTQAPGTPKKESRAELAKNLREAIRDCLALNLATAEDALASLDVWGVRLLLDFGDEDQWGPNLSVHRFGFTAIDLAVSRILELKLATYRSDEQRPHGYYVWTYRGRQAAKLLRDRGAKPYAKED